MKTKDNLAAVSPELLRNRQLCLAHLFYLAAAAAQVEHIGSRGGALACGPGGSLPHPALSDAWRMLPENPAFRRQVMLCRSKVATAIAAPAATPLLQPWLPEPEIAWEPCRPVPETDGWFETVWKEFRDGYLHHS